MKVLFANYQYDPKNPRSFLENAPYFAVTSYYQKLMKQHEKIKLNAQAELKLLKKKKKIIQQLAGRIRENSKKEFTRHILNSWLRQTKRKTKAYWINIWKSNVSDKEIIRKTFYGLFQYTKRKKNNKLKKLYDNLSENYDKMQEKCNDLKKQQDDFARDEGVKKIPILCIKVGKHIQE